MSIWSLINLSKIVLFGVFFAMQVVVFKMPVMFNGRKDHVANYIGSIQMFLYTYIWSYK